MDVLKNADAVENGLKELSLDDQRAVVGGDGFWAGTLAFTAIAAGIAGGPVGLALLAAAGFAGYELVQ
jgi:hypothetical protein